MDYSTLFVDFDDTIAMVVTFIKNIHETSRGIQVDEEGVTKTGF